MTGPLDGTERELLETYRDSIQHDQVLLALLLAAWPRLSPAQRGAIYRTADLFVGAAAWRPIATADEKGGA